MKWRKTVDIGIPITEGTVEMRGSWVRFIKWGPGLFSVAILTACSHTATSPPAVEVRTVTVDRPVAIACVKRSSIPTEPKRVASDLTGDPRKDLDTISASALLLRQWGRELAALVSGCVG